MLHDLDEHSSSDLLAAERIGLPITLVIPLVVFGAPLAALLPIVLALSAMTLGLAGLLPDERSRAGQRVRRERDAA